ncbi:MAG: hypothetical protein LQ349_007600 [Xanthoria aureola]|nr:MAG: hypothetical protein LQ349_007600 [Xanthoria aureola]
MASLPPPPGGDHNRAAEVHTFTWVMVTISIIFVLGRMYSRSNLTKDVWWDDWLCPTHVMYYLNRLQLSHAGELNAISRSLCVVGIRIGKISVAFLIERFAGPSRWRRWLLRSISINIAVSAIITVTLFYVQCQPVRAVWDKSLVKAGKAKCWDPVPLNKYVLPSAIEFLCPLDGPFFDGTTKVESSHCQYVHLYDGHVKAFDEAIIFQIFALLNRSAGYWAFLDFALATIPVDIIWKLQLSRKKKVGLVYFCPPVSWTTELLMWGGIEMNVIIVAACIPTLRPLVLVLLGRPSGSQYRNGASSRRSYSQHLGPNRFSARHNPPSHTSGIHANKAFDSTTELHSIASDKNKPNAITVNREVRVQSGETISDDDNNMKRVEGQWG